MEPGDVAAAEAGGFAPLTFAPDIYLLERGERLGLYRGPDFLALPLPERRPILGPWLVEQSPLCQSTTPDPQRHGRFS